MIDPARVAVVEAALEVAEVGCTRAHAWAVAIVESLDAHDAHERIDHPRGQLGWGDELDADDGSDA